MKNLMKGISDRKSFDESFLAAYGKNLNDIERDWISTLTSNQSSAPIIKTENIEVESKEKMELGEEEWVSKLC